MANTHLEHLLGSFIGKAHLTDCTAVTLRDGGSGHYGETEGSCQRARGHRSLLYLQMIIRLMDPEAGFHNVLHAELPRSIEWKA